MEKLSELAGGHEQLHDAVGRIEKQISALLTDQGDRPSQDDEQASRLEHHLSDVKELLAGVAARIDDDLERPQNTSVVDTGYEQGLADLREHVDARMTEVLARIDAVGTGGDDADASRLSELAGNQDQLKTAVARLEEQVSAALENLGSEAASDGNAVIGVEQQLADLSAQLAAVGARIEGEVEPALASIRDREQDSGQLNDVIEKVDKRVADALAGLELQGTQVDGNAAARLSELATSHEQLNSAVGRLEEQLTGALADVGSRTAPDGETVAGVEQQLALVSEQLAALGGRIENEVEPVLAALQQREQDDGVEKGLADLHAQLSAITEQVDKRLADALSELDAHANQGDGDGKSKAGSRKKSSPAAKAKAAPSEPRGPKAVMTAMLDAINSADPRRIRKFVGDEYSESALAERSIKDRVDVYLSFHDEAGEVALCHIDESGGEEIVAVVQETDSPQRHRFMITLDPTPPHKIYVVNIDAL
jgi:DNA repair exonuclease SbcCD ATPase subunit